MWSLAVFTPIAKSDPPTELRVYGPDAIEVQNITTSPSGGFVQAVVRFRIALDESSVPAGSHLELRWNGGKAFEGILRRPSVKGLLLESIEIAGYAQALLDRDPWETAALARTGEPELPMTEVLAMALARAPQLTQGQPWGEDGGRFRGYVTLSELSDRTPWQVAEQLATAMGFDLMVYEDRIAVWKERTAPDPPDYRCELAVCDYEPDLLDIFTRIVATYTDPLTKVKARTEEFPDLTAEAELGFSKRVVKDAGTVSLAYARAWAQQQLRLGVVPTVRASIGPVAALPDWYQNDVEGPLVRSGQWVQVGPVEGGRGKFAIVGTTVGNDGQVTVQLNERPLSQGADQAALRKAVSRIAAVTNLNTGGPG